MKTYAVAQLLAVFCLFSSQALGQKGSIEKLLEKNGFKWQESQIARPDDFDKEKSLDKGATVTRLGFGRGESKLGATQVLGTVAKFDCVPASLKEALQFRDPNNGLYAGMIHGKTTVFLGSSVRVGTTTYYPMLHWQKGAEKGVIIMTDDPFCCEDVNIVVKR